MIHFVLIPEIYLPFKPFHNFFFQFLYYICPSIHCPKMRILGIRHLLSLALEICEGKFHLCFISCMFSFAMKKKIEWLFKEPNPLLCFIKEGCSFTYSTKVTSAKVVHQDINRNLLKRI